MNWISRLSWIRAIVVASLWPIGLVVLTVTIPGLAGASSLWIVWRGNGDETYFLRVRVVHWPTLAIVLAQFFGDMSAA